MSSKKYTYNTENTTMDANFSADTSVVVNTDMSSLLDAIISINQNAQTAMQTMGNVALGGFKTNKESASAMVKEMSTDFNKLMVILIVGLMALYLKR